MINLVLWLLVMEMGYGVVFDSVLLFLAVSIVRPVIWFFKKFRVIFECTTFLVLIFGRGLRTWSTIEFFSSLQL